MLHAALSSIEVVPGPLPTARAELTLGEEVYLKAGAFFTAAPGSGALPSPNEAAAQAPSYPVGVVLSLDH